MTFSNIIISGVCSNAVPRISLHSASVKVNQGPEVELSFTVSIMYSVNSAEETVATLECFEY